MENINPGQSMHNIGGTVRIKGTADFALLEEAIRSFVKTNEGIRLRLTESEGDVRQYISDDSSFPIDYFDFSAHPNPEAPFTAWVRQEASAHMPIYDNALFYFALLKLGDRDNGYFVKAHHMVADGWSMNLLTEQICGAYLKLLKGEEATSRTGNSYLSYIEQEQTYLASARLLKNRKFWNDKFSALPEPAGNAGLECGAGNRKTFSLRSGQTERIKQFAADHNISLYTFFVALYLIYLHKLSRRDDLVVGLPLLNRAGKQEKSMVGMFTSTMPFRFRMDAEVPASQLIGDMNRELTQCYYHQRYPFDLLVQDLELNKKGYGPLFHSSVNYYNTRLMNDLNGIPIENEEFYSGEQLYSFQLIIREWSGSGELQLDMDYKLQDYTEERIQQTYNSLLHLADQVVQFPDRKLSGFNLVAEEDWNRRIYEFNATEFDYPKEKTIHRLFAEQAARTPDRIALRLNNQTLTYRGLHEKSNQLARFLLGKGVKRGVIVGLSTKHSMETIIGILGILKAGGAYLPVDPGLPPDRIHYMLQDSGTSILLTNNEMFHSSNLSRFEGEVIQLNSASLYTGEDSDLGDLSGPSDLVYIIYTSGSTGLPKGAMIEHRGLVNYVCWAKRVYADSGETDVFALYSSLTFDLTVTSIFTPLIGGGQIAIYPADDNEYVLYKIVREAVATIVKLTPSHLSLLKDTVSGTGSIRTFIVGGEDLKTSLASSILDRFGSHVTIYNEYGPTETVVGCMIHRFDAGKDQGISVPIGIPAQNMKIYILDPELNPVPDGETGELYISGDGVARGYLNRPELTKERFINNPFVQGKRMYKTGDLARFKDGGRIEYAGRTDSQVKIRGHRIEPGEIEHCMTHHPGVKEAVAMDREDRNGGRYLCVYYTGQEEIPAPGLANFLKEYLPEYMIPAYFVALDAIPLTINGKVDKAALPEPAPAGNEPAAREAANGMERLLVDTVGHVLNAEDPSLKDNFYYLGGDSIKAIQIASRLGSGGYRIKVKDILVHPVISDMALYVETIGGGAAGEDSPCVGVIKPLPSTSWLFSQRLPDMNHYTQSVLLQLKGELYPDKLETALNMIIRHHDAFRINYIARTGELSYNDSLLLGQCEIRIVDLSGYPVSEQPAQISGIGEKLKASFDIENGVLIKACIFHLGGQDTRLLMTAHHLAVDGISWRIIFEDMSHVYEQLLHNKIAALPPKTCSVQDWAAQLEQFGRGPARRSLPFWNEQVVGTGTETWSDFDLGADAMECCATVEYRLAEDETKRLLFKANDAYRTKGDELMLIALALVMRDYTKTGDVLVEIERHGREEIADHIDISRTVGWFTSLYPVRLAVPYTGLSSQIKLLKDQLRGIPNNGLCHGVLKYVTGELDGDPGKNVRFNYLGDFNASFTSGIFEYAEEPAGRDCSGRNEMSCLLDIVAYMVNNRLKLSITYSRNKFRPETAERFARSYMDRLREVIDHCSGRDHSEFTPADFETTDLSSDELEHLFND
ncbi:amino acid adenylation domain-containing protein [Paenibacillus sepulcri]|uniref:Amino acid adenylation domain-containing protein n=2 Tax=Paenibacillus sepulcri TaxID=359917 RepID=A0ABS7BXF6_9BACL|nr:amino acid adenylation domain-containing protein [Paenibacillus sepulcri]